MSAWYTDAEIDDLCEGLVSNAAKVRFLERLGLTVSRKPNGRPLLMRAHAELVLSGGETGEPPAPAVDQLQPQREALILHFQGRGGR